MAWPLLLFAFVLQQQNKPTNNKQQQTQNVRHASCRQLDSLPSGGETSNLPARRGTPTLAAAAAAFRAHNPRTVHRMRGRPQAQRRHGVDVSLQPFFLLLYARLSPVAAGEGHGVGPAGVCVALAGGGCGGGRGRGGGSQGGGGQADAAFGSFLVFFRGGEVVGVTGEGGCRTRERDFDGRSKNMSKNNVV